jgi:WD40 repeat protein
LIGYPVNVLGFSPLAHSWLYSGGSDRNFLYHDLKSSQTIKRQVRKAPITAAALTSDGNCIALASGNDWHTGCNEKWDTDISIQLMTDVDYK